MLRFLSMNNLFLFIGLAFSISLYGQTTIIPLTEGGWVGGLSGNISWDNYNTTATIPNDIGKYDGESSGFGYSISSRNGRFVIDDLSVGFDLQWSEEELTTNYASGTEDYKKNRLGFIGLWSRFYIPFIGTGWAIFPEASIGYANYKSETDRKSSPAILQNEEFYADGLAYNLGFGATMFVSNNVAFEATLRYQGGTLKGDWNYHEYESNNLEIDLSNIDILFGIMIYLK